ncbi:hypothetical protein [uncultured Flavobacterium sp.]|uniref:hypothetical protein n=1 Tax=uncultured Flavobacterium sp. TaxID=165435 RepID=UPI0030EEF9CF|tara:strand:- start:144 stop:560 length:417 start_codon:yes stop_codon:yes gene_type:complete
MKVKVLLTLLLFITSISIKAQESKSKCDFEYSVRGEKSQEGLNFEDRFVNFKWEVSKLSQKVEISIEVVKIFDCFNAIEGKQLDSYIFINLKDEELLNKNSFKILHTTMVAKCFKWRVIVKSDSCTDQTDWNYYSFLD